MNFLLTGAAGYIGSHTAVALLQAGHQVCILDNLSNSSKVVVDTIAEVAGTRPDFVEADVRDTPRVAHALKRSSAECVVHFAGLKAVGESVVKPLDYYSNNVLGTLSLLQAMREAGLEKLVFSSSATVYGEPKYLPIDEDHPTGATSPYGRSKLHIEEMLRDLATSDPDWGIACLRYFNPVGAHESGLLGENPRGIPNNLMPYVAQVAVGERPHLNVYGSDYDTPDGTGVRDYVHVMDLAEAHIAALEYLQNKVGWHAFNLGTGRGFSVLEVVSAFEAASGLQVAHKFTARRSGDVASCYASPAKAKKLLSWSASRGLQEMCDSAWKFQSGLSLAGGV